MPPEPPRLSSSPLRGSFRRLALFPVLAGEDSDGPAAMGALAPVFVTARYGAAARGLAPLPAGNGGRTLGVNLPFWGLLCLFATFSLLWSTTLRQLDGDAGAAPSAVQLATPPVTAALTLLRRTAAAFPRARSVVLARLGRAGGQWTLVEVDGATLRTRLHGADLQSALASAGIRLEPGDRLVAVPNGGPPLVTMVGTASRDAAPAAGTGSITRVAVQRAIPFTVVDSGVPVGERIAAATVGEALRAAGVNLDQADVVSPAAETPLAPGVRIAIVRAQPVSIAGADFVRETRTLAPTVGALLAEQEIAVGELDRVEPPIEAPVPAGGTVLLRRVREEEVRELQFVPFQTRVEPDQRLAPGRQVRVRSGIMGIMERLVKVVFEDNTEVSRQAAAEMLVREPIDELVSQGPTVIPVVALPGVNLPLAITPPAPAQGGPPPGTAVKRMLTMEATAYDPGPISTGKRPGDPGYGITATGMRATFGVVAVDPRVIPFYTRMYIPGYGFAVAADTGSAIVGNRIDLFYNSYDEAIRWGRKSVPVYILD